MKQTDQIFNKYRSQLQRFIEKRVSSREDAEDILQDVFYRFLQMDFDEEPVQQFSSWLYTVARHLIIDKGRKHKEESLYPYADRDEEDVLEDLTIMLLDEESSPELDLLKTLIRDELAIAMDELPDEQRAVFELTELQGCTFKEISESTGISVNTLLSRKRYAVLHLRKRLADLYADLLSF